MKLLNGQKFESKKTGNILTIADMRGNSLMIESTDGSESMHRKEAFEAAIESGDYKLVLMSAVELAMKIERIVCVPLKTGFRIDAEFEDGSVVVLKKKSTRIPEAVQLYSGIANFNSSSNSIGKHFTFSKTFSKGGFGGNLGHGGNHLRSFKVECD